MRGIAQSRVPLLPLIKGLLEEVSPQVLNPLRFSDFSFGQLLYSLLCSEVSVICLTRTRLKHDEEQNQSLGHRHHLLRSQPVL